MKISNLIVAAAMALSSLGVFSASVTKKNYDEISGNDDVVVDVDLSGISGSADTNTVNGLIGEYDRTNLAERIDRKRDKDDFRVYRKMKDCWTWTSNPVEDAPEEAPADFLAYANSPGAPALYCRYGYWYGATQFWPDGRYKYDASTIPPSGGELRTNIQWKISARAPDGTELYRFGALSVRQDPTNETLVSWTDSPVNEYVRLATTDLVDLRALDVASAATNGIRRIDGAARPLPKYLHALSFDSSYPEEAEAYYRRADAPFGGGCSARRVGNVCERNYDWNFDESAEFVVRISAASNRFASIGVCSVGTNLTEEMVTSGKWSPFYKVLPGRTLDGINENGVFCEINVVATNGVAEWETETEGRDINSMGAVRWVLDHATDAHMAATSLAARVYISPAMKALGYSAHYAICDKKGTYVVEDGDVMEWDPTVPAVMTNFRLWNYGMSSHDDPYGTGFERFDILCDNTKSITNAWFTGAYSPDLPRLTEFAAPGIGTHTETNALRAYAEAHVVPNLPPKRNGLWWQTVHTSVYDIEAKSVKVAVQEKDDWYVFALAAAGTDETKVREIVGPMIADHIPPAISNATGRIDADLTVTDTGKYGDWTPSHTPIPENPVIGSTYYSNPSYAGSHPGGYAWRADQYEWSQPGPGMPYEWLKFQEVYFNFTDYPSPDATELTFPDGTKTYRHKITIVTKLATTNDLAAAVKDAVTPSAVTNIVNEKIAGKADEFTEWDAGGYPNVQEGSQPEYIKTNKTWRWETLVRTEDDDFYYAEAYDENGDATELVFGFDPPYGHESFDATRKRVLRTGYIPSAISNATGRIDADLTAYVTETYADWTPNSVTHGGIVYSNVQWLEMIEGWVCNDGSGMQNMLGDYTNPDATELTFPDGTKTYRARKVTTKLATTNDLAAAISTNNSAFVTAVRNTPAPTPDPGEESPWGTYGTLGAAIAGIFVALKSVVKKIKCGELEITPTNGVADVADLFSESNTSTAANPDLNNKVLQGSVNALIDAKVGYINDALDSINGEVA